MTRAAQQPDAPDERGASDGRSQVIRVFGGQGRSMPEGT